MLRWRLWIRPLLGALVVAYILFSVWPLQTMSYDLIPRPGETFDEYAFAWAGASMMEHGIPVAWTTNLSSYQDIESQNGGVFTKQKIEGLHLTYEGYTFDVRHPAAVDLPILYTEKIDYGIGERHVVFVEPFLDHPPLASLIYGSNLGSDVQTFTDVKAEDFRKVNRYLFVLTGLLVGMLAYQLGGVWMGTFASGVFLTMPSMMLAHRLSLAENVLVIWMLLGLIGVFGWRRYNHWLWLLGVGIVSGLGLLTKFSGVVIPIMAIWLLYRWGVNWKQWLWVIVPSVILGSMFVWYGMWLSADLFGQVMLSQASRGDWGAMNVYQGLGRLFFHGFPLDGWWTGGLVVLLYAGWRDTNMRWLAEISLIYLAVMIMLGGGHFAWYLFPLGSIWALGYGWLMKQGLLEPQFVGLLLLIIFGLMSSFYWGEIMLNPDIDYSWIIRGIFVLIIGGWLLYDFVSRRWPRYFWKYIWMACWLLLLFQIMVWNQRSMMYVLSHWGGHDLPLMWPII